MADKARIYDYERAEHTSVTVWSKQEEDNEWRPYVGPEGGTGWTNGEQVNYDDSFAPDPANINEEATEQFLQQVPKDERADARDELGIPESEREADAELSSGVQEAISRLEELAGQIKRGEWFAEAKFEMQSVVEEQTGIDSVSFRTRPTNIEKSARCGKQLLRLSDSEDLSGLDEFRVDPNDDDLKGLRGVASGRYKIRDSKIVINPDQFDEDVVQEWAENGHWVGSEPESIVTHETAHHLHAENTAPLDLDADVHWNATKGELDDSVEELVAEEISDYAATMIGEFIAEAYVLQKEGGTLPEVLRDLYEQYNGPEVA